MELYLCRETGDKEKNKQEQWIRFPIKIDEVVKLGRSAELPIRLLSPHVSRIHAILKKTDDNKFYIKDQKSLNGIHVNGTKIESEKWHELHAKNGVEIGRPDDENILKTMNSNDRFIYDVLSAPSNELDKKQSGPKLHMSECIKKIVKMKPSKKLPQNTDKKLDNVSKESKPIKTEKRTVKSISPVKNVAETNTNNAVDSNESNNNEMKIPSRSETNDEMERENKRLKLELEQKEQALQEEIDLRNKRLEDEQKKITAQLEENYKTKLEQKEEELEMRLQLEKDIALEQCKATIEKNKEDSSTIKTVVDTMENELQCAICSELFIVSTTLNCAHTFCEYCIKEWKKVNSICPVCRQPILTLTRSLVLDNYISKALEGISPMLKEKRESVVEERKKIELEAQNRETRNNRGRGRGSRGGRRGNNSSRGRGATSYNSNTRGSRGGGSRQNIGDRGNHSGYRTRSTNIVVISDEDSFDSDESDPILDYRYHYNNIDVNVSSDSYYSDSSGDGYVYW